MATSSVDFIGWRVVVKLKMGAGDLEVAPMPAIIFWNFKKGDSR